MLFTANLRGGSWVRRALLTRVQQPCMPIQTCFASSQTTQPSEKHSQPPVGTSAALHQYIVQHTREPQLMRDLREETADLFPQAAHMPVFPEQAAFLAWLVAAIGARRAIEIGVFTGCSAIAVAQALPPDGSLFAIDRDPRSMAVAERYFAQAGVQHKINTRVAPAAAVLDELLTSNEHIGQYDFAFVGTILQLRPVCQHLQYPDADKRGYAGYLEQLLQLVRVGGIIAFDNVLWYGKVADPEHQDKQTLALRELNASLAVDQRVDFSLVAVGDGIALCRRLQ